MDDPLIDRQLFEEADVPKRETYPILPTWDSSPWASEAPQRILAAETPFPAGVTTFGPQKPVHPTADARFINESWTTSFPLEASFGVSMGILQSDANPKEPLPGEILPVGPHQDMSHLGTQSPPYLNQIAPKQ